MTTPFDIWMRILRPQFLLLSFSSALIGTSIAPVELVDSTMAIVVILFSVLLQLLFHVTESYYGDYHTDRLKYCLISILAVVLALSLYLCIVGGWLAVVCVVIFLFLTLLHASGYVPVAEGYMLFIQGALMAVFATYMQLHVCDEIPTDINSLWQGYEVLLPALFTGLQCGCYSVGVLVFENMRHLERDREFGYGTLIVRGGLIAGKVEMFLMALFLPIIAVFGYGMGMTLGVNMFFGMVMLVMVNARHRTFFSTFSMLVAVMDILAAISAFFELDYIPYLTAPIYLD